MAAFDSERGKPEILAVRTAAQTRIFQVQAVDLRFANGTERTYERLTPARRPAVMVLALHEGSLMMIREYAVGTERYELTLPKGLIDEGETPEQAANRELQEEIGMAARSLKPLRVLYSSPSHMYSPMHVFLAEDLYPSQLEGDEPEPLGLHPLPLSRLDEILDNPATGDSRTLAALFLLQRLLAEH